MTSKRRTGVRVMGNRTCMRSILTAAAALALAGALIAAAPADDAKAIVAALDTQYQAQVKANDAAAMDRILADDFVLVPGRGQAFTTRDVLKDARDQTTSYGHHEEEAGSQTVR